MGGGGGGHAEDRGVSTAVSHLLRDGHKVRDQPNSAGPAPGVPAEGLRHGQ